MYRSERFEMRLTEKDAELLDQVRGSATRAAWLRAQIHHAAGRPIEDVELPQTVTSNECTHPHWKKVGDMFRECADCGERARR